MKEKLWSRDFIIVMIACAGISFCNYFFSSTLPIYARDLTGTTVYAGVIMTVYTFAALITRPVTGLLSDRFGRVKLLIIGAALSAVACFLYSLAPVIALLIVFRILHGIGFGIHSTSGGAVAADVIPKARMSEGLGIFGLYGTIASALGPGIALSIIGGGGRDGFRLLFYLAAGISVLCLVLDSLIRYQRKAAPAPGGEQAVPSPPPDPAAAEPAPRTFLGFEGGVVTPSLVIIFLFIALSSVTAFLTLFAQERGYGNIGLFFTLSAAGMFFSRAVLGKVADRRGADLVVLPSLAALIAIFLLLPLMGRPVFLFLLAAPLGLAQGAVCPAINTMLFRRCSPQRRGSAAAAYFSSIDIGIGAGALLFGFVAEKLGYAAVYWAAAGFAAAALAVYLLFLAGGKQAK